MLDESVEESREYARGREELGATHPAFTVGGQSSYHKVEVRAVGCALPNCANRDDTDSIRVSEASFVERYIEGRAELGVLLGCCDLKICEE